MKKFLIISMILTSISFSAFAQETQEGTDERNVTYSDSAFAQETKEGTDERNVTYSEVESPKKVLEIDLGGGDPGLFYHCVDKDGNHYACVTANCRACFSIK